MSKQTITHKERFKNLVAHISAKPEVPEEGFLTVQEWMAESGLGREHTTKSLKRGVETGVVEVKHFRILSGQRVMKVPHYRVKI